MKVVPRGLELMTVKRLLRVVACVDESAVTALYLDSMGLEDRPFVVTDEVNGQQLSRRVHLEANVLERVTLFLHVPDGPSDGGINGDRLHLTPSVQAAVRGDGAVQ